MLRPTMRPMMIMLAAVTLGACGPKGPQAGEGTADTTAAIVPIEPTDTTPPTDTLKATDTTRASAPPGPGPIIGYDSAFGPTFTVDSTGKVTPIAPAKKKP